MENLPLQFRLMALLICTAAMIACSGASSVTDQQDQSSSQNLATRPQVTATVNSNNGLHHFNTCAFRTGQNAIIGIPAEIGRAGDFALEPGDEIAVVTPGDSLCAGASAWTGSNIAITAWGDNSQTDVIDGLQEGEELQFLIWDSSADREVVVSEAEFAEGNGRYQTDGIYVVVGLKVAQP